MRTPRPGSYDQVPGPEHCGARTWGSSPGRCSATPKAVTRPSDVKTSLPSVWSPQVPGTVAGPISGGSYAGSRPAGEPERAEEAGSRHQRRAPQGHAPEQFRVPEPGDQAARRERCRGDRPEDEHGPRRHVVVRREGPDRRCDQGGRHQRHPPPRLAAADQAAEQVGQRHRRQHEDQGQQHRDHRDDQAEGEQGPRQGGVVDRGVRRRLRLDVQEDHHDGEGDLQTAHQHRDQQHQAVRPLLMLLMLLVHGQPPRGTAK